MNKPANPTPTLPANDVRHQRAGDDLLHYIEPGHDTCQGELQALAQHLCPHLSDQDALLTEASRLAFVTLGGYLFDNYLDEQELGFPFAYYPTIGAVGRLAYGDVDLDTSSRRWLWGLMQRPFLAEWTRSGFSQLLQLSERQLRLVLQTLSNGLHDIVQPAPDRMH